MKSLFGSLRRQNDSDPKPPVPTPIATALDEQKLRTLLALVNDQSQPNLNALAIATRNIDILALNVKALGYDLAQALASALPVRGETAARPIGLASKASTQADIESDWVAHWCGQLKVPVIFHRKLWELSYVLQAIFDGGHLRPGARGVGFGCGSEPLASYFASLGMFATVTDLPTEDARAAGWRDTNQLASSSDQAFHPHLVTREAFDAHVDFKVADMNAIPDDLTGYDFCWSICAVEHLGSIANGLAHIRNSLATLRPGGTAIHTLEFNINPLGPTIDNWPTVLFQQRHMEELAAALAAEGHRMAPLDFDTGNRPMDRFIDLPPWHDGTLEHISAGLGQPYHLKVGIDGFVSTCFGVVITKAGGTEPVA